MYFQDPEAEKKRHKFCLIKCNEIKQKVKAEFDSKQQFEALVFYQTQSNPHQKVNFDFKETKFNSKPAIKKTHVVNEDDLRVESASNKSEISEVPSRNEQSMLSVGSRSSL